jgi:dTDP-4-dehydrorhamnose 3,5-epimerase-like enzyme
MGSLGLKSYKFQCIIEKEEQGILSVFESKQLPFSIKRTFTVVNSIAGAKRGQHAHKKCNQLLCCISGRLKLICDDGITQVNKLLFPKGEGILVPQGVWAEQIYLDDNSVLIVFCDRTYEESDYIRDYDKYLEWKENQK